MKSQQKNAVTKQIEEKSNHKKKKMQQQYKLRRNQ